MKVKELIEKLLDEPMNSGVMIHTPDKHMDEFGQEVNGYAFYIDDKGIISGWKVGDYV